jgi:NTP pyrophosphatase (non-canonical NTP hydrolase)
MVDFDELNDFADWEAKRQEKLFEKRNEEMIFKDAIKLSEENGETMDALLNYLGLQRREKLKDKVTAKKELGSEIADVILTAAILAKRLNINISDVVEDKINIVRARKY